MKRNMKSILIICIIFMISFSVFANFKVNAEEVADNSNLQIEPRSVEMDASKITETVGEDLTENSGDDEYGVEAIAYEPDQEEVTGNPNLQIEPRSNEMDASKITETTGEELTENSSDDEYGVELISYEDDQEKDAYEYAQGDIFVTEENVEIDQNIDGNIFIVGENVKISSKSIIGDIFVVAKNVEISGYVSGSVFAVADNFVFTGVTNSIYACSKTITMSAGSYIYRDVRVCGEDVFSDGIIAGNLYAVGTNITISENENDSTIFGNLYYSGNLVGQTNAVKGEITNCENETVDENNFEKLGMVSKVLDYITVLFVLLVIIAILVACTTSKDQKYKSDIKEKFITDTLLGFLMLIVIPIISIILMVSVIGIFAGILLLLAYVFVLICLVEPVVSIEIAKKLTENKNVSTVKLCALAILINVVIILISDFLEIYGFIVSTIICSYGLGVIVRKSFARLFKKNSKKDVIDGKAKVVSEEKKENQKIEEAKSDKEEK